MINIDLFLLHHQEITNFSELNFLRSLGLVSKYVQNKLDKILQKKYPFQSIFLHLLCRSRVQVEQTARNAQQKGIDVS